MKSFVNRMPHPKQLRRHQRLTSASRLRFLPLPANPSDSTYNTRCASDSGGGATPPDGSRLDEGELGAGLASGSGGVRSWRDSKREEGRGAGAVRGRLARRRGESPPPEVKGREAEGICRLGREGRREGKMSEVRVCS